MYLNAYSLPYALSKKYYPLKIATDKKETFAVFTFKNGLGCEEIIFTFTEEDGFVKAEDYKHSVEEQEGLFSVPLEFSDLVLLF